MENQCKWVYGFFYTSLSFLVRLGCSWSFKVNKIGTNRKPIFDFLSLFHCKYMHMASKIQRFVGRKSAFFAVFTNSSPFEALAREFWDLRYESWYQKSRIPQPPDCATAWSYIHWFSQSFCHVFIAGPTSVYCTCWVKYTVFHYTSLYVHTTSWYTSGISWYSVPGTANSLLPLAG